jgi:hypothetical protein
MKKKLHSLLHSFLTIYFAGAGGWGWGASYSGDMKTTFALPFILVHFKGIKFLLIYALQVKMASQMIRAQSQYKRCHALKILNKKLC